MWMDMLFVQNGIETTVATHETLLRNNKNCWVQLAGHPGKLQLMHHRIEVFTFWQLVVHSHLSHYYRIAWDRL